MKATIAGLIFIWLVAALTLVLFWPLFWSFHPAAAIVVTIVSVISTGFGSYNFVLDRNERKNES